MKEKQSKTVVSTSHAKSPRPIWELMHEFWQKHPDKCMVVDPQTEKWVRLTEVSANYG